MNKIKKSITISENVYNMLMQIAKNLEITENTVIAIALTEYYNKIHNILH